MVPGQERGGAGGRGHRAPLVPYCQHWGDRKGLVGLVVEEVVVMVEAMVTNDDDGGGGDGDGPSDGDDDRDMEWDWDCGRDGVGAGDGAGAGDGNGDGLTYDCVAGGDDEGW